MLYSQRDILPRKIYSPKKIHSLRGVYPFEECIQSGRVSTFPQWNRSEKLRRSG
jgi:hypothetical protein